MRFILALILLFLNILPASGQGGAVIPFTDDTTLPADHVGVLVRALIQTINANDIPTAREFVNTNYDAAFLESTTEGRAVTALADVFHKTGGVDFYALRHYPRPPGGDLTIIVRDRIFREWRGLIVHLAAKKIDKFVLAAARPPAGAAGQSPVSEPASTSGPGMVFNRLCSSDGFSGNVLVAKGRNIMFAASCGMASRARQIPNDSMTRFNLASMNKMFTAVAIAQLAEAGKLKYSDTIAKWIGADWLPARFTRKITVHHLLTHTSGLGSYLSRRYFERPGSYYSKLSDFRDLVQFDTLAFSPGKAFSYSNTGMLLLGVIIEKVSGEDYYSYIQKHIYEPAGMSASGTFKPEPDQSGIATGYTYTPLSDQVWSPNTSLIYKGSPAGGGYATVGDLHRFALALLEQKLVSQRTLDLMWTNHSPDRTVGYGYGFFVSNAGGKSAVGHPGNFTGVDNSFEIFPKTGHIAIALSNYTSGAGNIKDYLRRLTPELN